MPPLLHETKLRKIDTSIQINKVLSIDRQLSIYENLPVYESGVISRDKF
jgi:hypothetical protein